MTIGKQPTGIVGPDGRVSLLDSLQIDIEYSSVAHFGVFGHVTTADQSALGNHNNSPYCSGLLPGMSVPACQAREFSCFDRGEEEVHTRWIDRQRRPNGRTSSRHDDDQK